MAGDGNRDRVWVIEALPKETGSKQAALPTSQAPSPDPTFNPRGARSLLRILGGVATNAHPPSELAALPYLLDAQPAPVRDSFTIAAVLDVIQGELSTEGQFDLVTALVLL